MAVKILDDSITFEAFVDHEDAGKVFYAGENNLYVTRDQARQIAVEILKALDE